MEDKKILIDQDLVDRFCECVNDTNIIHTKQFDKPIVPGNLLNALIFEKPSDNWRLARSEFRYFNPAFVGTEVDYRYQTLTERNNYKKVSVTIYQNETKCTEADFTLMKK